MKGYARSMVASWCVILILIMFVTPVVYAQQQEPPKDNVIVGTVRPSGTIVMIDADNGDKYLITPGSTGDKMVSLAGKKIKVTGRIVPEQDMSWKSIAVTSFEPAE